MVTTNGAWPLVDPLFGYVDQLPDGWSSLDGDVLAAGADGIVTNLSIDPGDASSNSPTDTTPWPVGLAIGAGCVALAAIELGAALWWRRRRGGAAQV